MSPDETQLAQVLLEMGLVDDRKVKEAQEHQKRKPGTALGQAMVELGFVDDTQLARALCRQHRLPFVDLSRAKISPQVAALVPKKVVNDFNVVPVKLQEGKLILATDNPMATLAVDDIRFALNREVVFALTSTSALANARAEAYGLGERVESRPGGAKGGKKEEESPDAVNFWIIPH